MNAHRNAVLNILLLASFVAGVVVVPVTTDAQETPDTCCESELPIEAQPEPEASADDCCEGGLSYCCTVCCTAFVTVLTLEVTVHDADTHRETLNSPEHLARPTGLPGIYRPPRA